MFGNRQMLFQLTFIRESSYLGCIVGRFRGSASPYLLTINQFNTQKATNSLLRNKHNYRVNKAGSLEKNKAVKITLQFEV